MSGEQGVEIYDVTLRDGTQGENISFSIHDKIRVTERLDDLGAHYIEGGWPGSNERDKGYFEEARKLRLANSSVAAFGSTRRARATCEDDPSIQALVRAETPVVTIVGKSWDFHVTEALKIGLEENLELVSDSVEYLKGRADKVFFDAEHFFDGWKRNPGYSMKVLETALEAGADAVVLCDTNGGSMPWEIEAAVRDARETFGGAGIGIHTHNDGEVGVANTLYAVREGATQVQGTMNGYGERCGNANLCAIIPNIALKLGRKSIEPGNLRKLYSAAHFIHELTNLSPLSKQAFVGKSAFAHKGGIHVSAIMKNPDTYEHVDPRSVGNRRRVLVSDLSGRANIAYKAGELGIDVDPKDERILSILEQLKVLENQGYEFEGADASFELLVRKTLGTYDKRFYLESARSMVEKKEGEEEPLSEAAVEVRVDGVTEHAVARGNGPVNAIDGALRKSLEKFFPRLRDLRLRDYRVRVLSKSGGTDSVVRVLVESTDGERNWSTVGVSENIVEASWKALVDSIDYKLLRDEIESAKTAETA